MNKVILVGRLTKDPELKTTTNGKSVATFSVAVDRRFKQDDQPTADFFNIVSWGRQAEVITQYLGKGRQIALSGRLQSRSYTAQDGSKRYVTEVVLEEFDFIGSNQKESSGSAPTPAPAQQDQIGIDEDFHLIPEGDDDVPF